MIIMGVSDPHFTSKQPIARIDDIKEVQRKKFKFVIGKAIKFREEDQDVVLTIPGDIFDRPRDWYLLPEVIDWLKILRENQIPVFVVYGQHDTYMYNEQTRFNTSLGILEKYGLVIKLDEMPLRYGGVDFYGASYGEDIPEVKHEDSFSVLLVHKEIGKHPHIDTVSSKAFLSTYKNYKLIVVGDIHQFDFVRIKDRYIVNTGPMVRHSASYDMMSHEPVYFKYNTITDNNLSFGIIPYKPALNVLTRDHIDRAEERESMLYDFVEMVKQDTVKNPYEITELILKLVVESVTDIKMRNKVKTIISEVMNRE